MADNRSRYNSGTYGDEAVDGSIYSLNVLGPKGQPARLTRGQRDDALAGAYNSIFANAYQFAGYTPDTLISSKGFQILDDQMTQARVKSALNNVRYAILYKGWSVRPFSRSRTDRPSPFAQEMADHYEYCLNEIIDEAGNPTDFRQTILEMDYAIHTGFRVCEIVWRSLDEGDYKGSWGFAEFAHKPCRQINFRLDKRTLKVLAITSYTPELGYMIDPGLPVEKCLRYTFDPRDNLPHGNGVGRTIYKHTWSKDNLTRFWNICLEVFGTPFILAKAPPGKATQLAQAALTAMRQGSTGVLPQNVEAQLLSVAQQGKSGFMEAIQYHDSQIALAYQHATLTSSEGQDHGTQSLGNVHQDTADYAYCAARIDTQNLLNLQLSRRWTFYNYGYKGLREMPYISLGDWDAVDTEKMTHSFKNLVDMGNMHKRSPIIREGLNMAPPSPEEQAALDEDERKSEVQQKVQLQAKQATKPGAAE